MLFFDQKRKLYGIYQHRIRNRGIERVTVIERAATVVIIDDIATVGTRAATTRRVGICLTVDIDAYHVAWGIRCRRRRC